MITDRTAESATLARFVVKHSGRKQEVGNYRTDSNTERSFIRQACNANHNL